MSTLKVDSITSRAGGSAPSFPDGVSVTGVVTATSFVKSGGTSSQYLMADGSTSSGGGGGGINNVVEDTTPQLGGNLDLNGNDITGTGDITATSFSGSGSSLTGLTGASAATYGSATQSAQIVVDSNGRITGITNVNISGGGGGGGSGSGLGLFNASVNGAAGYTVTTSNAAGYTAPNTSGIKYIVHSIQVTNTHATNSANLSVDINGTNYAGIHVAKTIPIDPGLSLELLKRPKVIHPSNAIRFLSNVGSILQATITYQSTTEAKYFGSGIALSNTSATDLYVASADSVVESILLANVEGVSDVKATVTWTNSSNSVQGYYVYELDIPADATVEILEAPKFVESGYKVKVTANVGGRLHAMVSGITV